MTMSISSMILETINRPNSKTDIYTHTRHSIHQTSNGTSIDI